MTIISWKTLGVGAVGILTGVVGFTIAYAEPPSFLRGYTDEVHVHADFLVYIMGENVDFSASKYQSSEGDVRHMTTHLHNGDGHVIHRHADDVTFADFLGSLGFTLTESCLTVDTGEQYCTGDTNTLRLYVNGEVEEDIEEYVTNEEDRILLYYGAPDAVEIETYLNEIPSDACISSGTCPERGVPQPETCGATCEL